MVDDEYECVGSCYSLFGWSVTFAYTLAKPTQLIGRGCIPGTCNEDLFGVDDARGVLL